MKYTSGCSRLCVSTTAKRQTSDCPSDGSMGADAGGGVSLCGLGRREQTDRNRRQEALYAGLWADGAALQKGSLCVNYKLYMHP